MKGAIHLLPDMPSWRGQEQIHLSLFFLVIFMSLTFVPKCMCSFSKGLSKLIITLGQQI